MIELRNDLTAPLYNGAGLSRFAFFETIDTVSIETENGEEIETDVFVPGAFTYYRSLTDLRNQLKAPVAMPIINLGQAVVLSMNAVQYLLLAAVNAVTLDFKLALYETNSARFNLTSAFLHTVIAVLHALSSLLLLATRTGATLFAGASAGIDAVAGLFFPVRGGRQSSEEEVEQELPRTMGPGGTQTA